MEIEEKLIICRVCFEPCNNTFEPVDCVIKDRLAVLSLKPDLSVKDPAVCRNCAESLERCSLFKTTCLNTEDYISSFVNQNTGADLDLTQTLLNSSKKGISVCEDDIVCRLCMELVRSESYIDLDDETETKNVTLFKIILKQYFPELNMNITRHPTICAPCCTSLRHYFGFMENCLDMEKCHEVEMSNCESQAGIISIQPKEEMETEGDHVILNDVKKCEQDNLCAENREINLKNEEVEIKSEQEDFDSVPPSQPYCKYNSKIHTAVHQKSTEVTYHECNICSFKTKSKYSLKVHMKNHNGGDAPKQPPRQYQCEICLFKTKHRASFNKHKLIHLSVVEPQTYCCNFCDYKSNCKDHLKSHLACHQDSSDITMYQCANCDFRSKRKSSLSNHMSIHLKSLESKLFECEVCGIKTKFEKDLKQHRMLIHQDPSEVKMYQCETCDFKSKYKVRLETHMLFH